MAIPDENKSRDQAAYIESPTQTGEVDRRTHDTSANATLDNLLGAGNIIGDIKFDEIQVTYPTTTTEVYTYKLATATTATVTITYVDTTKCDITSVVRT